MFIRHDRLTNSQNQLSLDCNQHEEMSQHVSQQQSAAAQQAERSVVLATAGEMLATVRLSLIRALAFRIAAKIDTRLSPLLFCAFCSIVQVSIIPSASGKHLLVSVIVPCNIQIQ